MSDATFPIMLKRMAERGGFGASEMDMFLPGWRERESEASTLRAALAAAEKERDEAKARAEQAETDRCELQMEERGLTHALSEARGHGFRVSELLRDAVARAQCAEKERDAAVRALGERPEISREDALVWSRRVDGWSLAHSRIMRTLTDFGAGNPPAILDRDVTSAKCPACSGNGYYTVADPGDHGRVKVPCSCTEDKRIVEVVREWCGPDGRPTDVGEMLDGLAAALGEK